MASAALTPEVIRRFHEDGAVCLRGVFTQEWIQKVTEGIEANMAQPSKVGERLKAPGDEGVYFQDLFNWQKIPQFKDFVTGSPAAEIAGTLMQSKKATFYYEHVLCKEPGAHKETPWHQDQPYYPVDGFKNCSIWLPIDPVPMETTLQFVKGSHRWGRWFIPKKFATANNYDIVRAETCGDRAYENAPDVNNAVEKYEILKWAVEPGDCVVFHMLTLHGAPGNSSETLPRRVLSTRWLGDDCVYVQRPWDSPVPVLGELTSGQHMADTFPTMWRAG
ncbi:uncharacterized protein LOC106150566 [Lingula anatina]|uniref:Uncharacterized protein LOC106150566 n=1 Tax=Lingula anatina TaxID=7574 RepID=A0A1S3GYF0_LINAN|nr:uncharacterized protein LOC106150566 [Lingula anatina]|eukprot:XP_013378900.1 uncharacterized protein LOC106150566 [Lingula anatina]